MSRSISATLHEDTSEPLLRGLVLAWAISAPFLCIIYMMIEPSPDQMQFDYMAWLSTQGAPYYAGSFDMNWPGAMILHEIGIGLFGVHAWTWHLTDFLLMQGITIMIVWALCLARLKTAAFIFLLLYPASYVTAGGWIAGQRDIIAGALLLATCALVLHRKERAGISLVGAGILIGYAVLIRPTFLSFAAIVAALELAGAADRSSPLRLRCERVGLLVLGGVSVFAGIAVLGLRAGNLDDWYQQAIFFAVSVYAGDPPQDVIGNLGVAFFRFWHWMTLGATVGLVAWLIRRGLDYPLALVAGLAVTMLISYFVQNKGFIYHLGGFVPLMVLLSAAGINILWELRSGAGLSGSFAKILCALIVLGCALGAGKKLYEERDKLMIALRDGVARPVAPPTQRNAQETEALVGLIRAGSQPSDYMIQYGTAFNIPYLAERKTSHRFINNVLEQTPPDFKYYDVWLNEVRDGLAQKSPAFVLVASKTGALPERESAGPALKALLDHVGSGYEIVLTDRFGVLLQRQDTQ